MHTISAASPAFSTSCVVALLLPKISAGFLKLESASFFRGRPFPIPNICIVVSHNAVACTCGSKQQIYQSINQTSITPISPAKPGSVARQPNQCSTAKSRKQFRNIDRPWAMTVSIGEKPNQRDVSSDIS